MCSKYCEIPGKEVNQREFVLPKSKDLFNYIDQNPAYVKIIKLTKGKKSDLSFEAVCFDFETETPQRKIIDIKERERVLVLFYEDDSRYPEVYVLRNDFPSIPHLNLQLDEYPKSICLYDQDWHQINLTWTPADFLKRLRFWFTESSTGTLHQEDQHLEPFIQLTTDRVIIDRNLIENFEADKENNKDLLFVGGIDFDGKRTMKVVKDCKRFERFNDKNVPGVALFIKTDPITHGIIRKLPRHLLDLSEMLNEAGVSILENLRGELKGFREGNKFLEIRDAYIVIFISMPLKRSEGAEPETIHHWAFIISTTIKDLGVDLDVYNLFEKEYALNLAEYDETKNGGNVPVGVLNIVYEFTPKIAAELNGKQRPNDEELTIIGLGALGSKIFDDLTRKGYYKFNLIDSDILLPHNLSRHTLLESAVGYGKVNALTGTLKNLLLEHAKVNAHYEDILNIKQRSHEVNTALKSSGYILDITASEPVSRHLANNQNIAPIITIFLSPSGKDLIILKEDTDRKIKIDCIEHQLYRFIYENSQLNNVFELQDNEIRYSGSCRDVTSKLPTSNITILAGIASASMDQLLYDSNARIYVWRMSDSFEISKYTQSVSYVLIEKKEDWCIFIDEKTLNELKTHRSKNLPNETGGILLGSYDTQRKKIYINHWLSGPEDSEQSEGSFIRGFSGLLDQIRDIESKTMGRLKYIGEWHTHPDGYSASASQTDKEAILQLSEHMKADALPFVMMIIGMKEYTINLSG